MSGSETTAVRRVLLLHDYAGSRGGAEVVMQDMRAALRQRGIDARLMASTADPADETTAADYAFRGSTGAFRALRETFNPDAVRITRQVMHSFDPQIVHLGMILTQASPAILPVLEGRAVVWAPSEYRAICPRGSRFLPSGLPCSDPAGAACLRNRCFRPHSLAPRLLQLTLLRHWRQVVDLVVSPSRAFADELERYGVPVDAVVPNGVRIQPLSDQPASAPAFVGFAGRLVPEKGTHVLLEALALLPPSLAQVRLRIIGDGPDRANLENLARHLGIGDRTEFLGHLSRDEMERCLTGATVQVVPSIWAEPFGLVAIEAMARGTPVVVSAAGALRELVEECRTGYLVPPGDARALAGRLADVLAHPDGLASVRREARRVVSEAFSIERAVDRFLDLYERVLSPAVATR